MANLSQSIIEHDRKFKSPAMDTHAMAYKLLLEMEMEEEEEESVSVKNDISEHGKEARMDFYQNRSRSDGASRIVLEQLKEMKKREHERLIHSDLREEKRNEDVRFELKKKDQGPFNFPLKHHDDEFDFEPSIERRGSFAWDESQMRVDPGLSFKGPLYIPASDSYEQLFICEPPAKPGTVKRFNENRFVPYFTLPSTSFIIHCLVDEQKVCLESFESRHDQFYATILVKTAPNSFRNTDRVTLRMTLDEWKAHQDIQAQFLDKIKERPNVDRYSAVLPLPQSPKPGMRLEFAVVYHVQQSNGQVITYWDNNNSTNYTFWYSG